MTRKTTSLISAVTLSISTVTHISSTTKRSICLISCVFTYWPSPLWHSDYSPNFLEHIRCLRCKRTQVQRLRMNLNPSSLNYSLTFCNSLLILRSMRYFVSSLLSWQWIRFVPLWNKDRVATSRVAKKVTFSANSNNKIACKMTMRLLLVVWML